MKKTLLSVLLFATGMGVTQAQITLTAATHTPKATTFYTNSFSDTGTTFTLPASGANLTWNFANVAVSSQDTTSYFNCVPQANCAAYGNANLLSGFPADSIFQYFKTGATAFQLTGIQTPDVQYKLSDPYDLYRYPFTYNTRFLETFSGTITPAGFPIPIAISGTDSVSGAGYGTLITPEGTYPNVLMLRGFTTNVISIPGRGADTAFGYRFEWFSATSSFPVMQLQYDMERGSNNQLVIRSASGQYQVGVPLGTAAIQTSANLSLVPNPTSGMVRIETGESFRNNKSTVIISDLTGKIIVRQSLDGHGNFSINTADWAKGIYLVRVQGEDGEALMQKLSVQ